METSARCSGLKGIAKPSDTAGEEVAYMLIAWTGRPAPVDGWYVDQHGHGIVLHRGEFAPICVFSGPAVVPWRLSRPLGAVSR